MPSLRPSRMCSNDSPNPQRHIWGELLQDADRLATMTSGARQASPMSLQAQPSQGADADRARHAATHRADPPSRLGPPVLTNLHVLTLLRKTPTTRHQHVLDGRRIEHEVLLEVSSR